MKVLALLAVAPATAFVLGPSAKSNGVKTFSYLDSSSVTLAQANSATSFADLPRQGVSATVARSTPVSNINQNNPLSSGGMPVQVQGGSLKTWSFPGSNVERAQIVLGTMGRPLNAKIELWQGPDNNPYKVDVYLEDGSLRPFKAIIELPGGSNTIAVQNEGHLEFPLLAKVEPESGPSLLEIGKGRVVQGGAVYTTPFEPNVNSVKLVLQTDGRPMSARIELMQGPYNDKQVMEIYTEDGMERPFTAVVETPGVGNVIRLVNTATVEFPLRASVEPYSVEQYS